jgi:hypothetical protein
VNNEYREISFLLGCAIYQYVNGHTFRPQLLINDMDFIGSPLAQKTNKRYQAFIEDYRQTDRWQEWYYNKLHNDVWLKNIDEPEKIKQDCFTRTLDNSRDPITGKLKCMSRWSLFSYPERMNKMLKCLVKERVVSLESTPLGEQLITFYKFSKDKEVVEQIKKTSFIESI